MLTSISSRGEFDSVKLSSSLCTFLHTKPYLANVLLFLMFLYCSGLTVHSYVHTATSTNMWGLYNNVLTYYMMQEHKWVNMYILDIMLYKSW